MGFMDFLSINTGDIIFTLINTLILFFIVKRLLFGRVNKILDERKQAVTNTYQQADTAKADAEKLKSDYTVLMENAKDKSAEIIKTATQKAQHYSDEIVMEAKKNATATINKANEEIEYEKKRAVLQVKDEISDIALMVAEKVVEKEINANDNERLINDFINNVGDFK